MYKYVFLQFTHMKKTLFAAFLVTSIVASAISVVAIRPLMDVLDESTFTCPEDQQYCFLEFWRDGRLAGRRRMKPGETIDVKMLGAPKCETGFTTEYRCRGRNLFGKYQDEKCRISWK